MIPVYEPTLDGNEFKYVNECLETNWISSKGRFSDLFSAKFSEYSSINYVTPVSNGTCALTLALATLDIPLNSEILIPSFGYVAVAASVVRYGAIPVFVDIDQNNLQIDPSDVERKINAKTSAIIGIHNYGFPYKSEKINNIAKKYNLYHIEDCAEAIGTKSYSGEHVGNESDISTFSLYANKTITAGEGGLVCSNSSKIIETANNLKNHAISEVGIYDHNDYGFNFRMTNIASAIALGQLEKIEEKLERKKEIANRYKAGIDPSRFLFFDPEPSKNLNSFWMNTLLTKDIQNTINLREQLKKNNIESRPLFKPVHLMEPYKKFVSHELPISDKISGCGINLPSSPSLKNNQIDFIIDVINKTKT